MTLPGDRIRLLAMPDDPDPIRAGTTGTVLSVTDGMLGQVSVHWDDGRSLSLVPGVDRFEVIGHSDLVAPVFACPGCGNCAMDLLEWDEFGELLTCSICDTTYQPS